MKQNWLCGDPRIILERWFIDAPLIKSEAVMAEYERVRDELYGDVQVFVWAEFKAIVDAMFPNTEGQWPGIRVELEDKLNEYEASR